MAIRSSSSSPRLRPHLTAVALALALLLGVVACGGGDDPEAASVGTTAPVRDGADGTTSSTTAPDDTADAPAEETAPEPDDAVCADMVATVLEPVHVPAEEADVYAYDEEAFQAAIGRLAEDGPAEIAEDAARVEAAMASAEEDPSDDEVISLVGAFERLIAWGAENCDVEGPLWACFVRSSFTEVGQAIPGPGQTTPPPTGGAATPEAAVGDGEGERVEAFRSDDEVVFAWLDERGLAVRSEVAERISDGWDADESTECRDEDSVRFDPIPAPVDEDDQLPPPTTEP